MNEFNVLLAAATNGTPSGSLFDALFARYISPQESWRELESPLPITILAAGEDLIDYRIYGDSGGVGEEILINLPEPLRGIGTYADVLDLSTGMLTKRIESFTFDDYSADEGFYDGRYFVQQGAIVELDYKRSNVETCCLCSHLRAVQQSSNGVYGISNAAGEAQFALSYLDNGAYYAGAYRYSTPLQSLADWKQFRQDQAALDAPITVWYVSETPTIRSVQVPPGLTGSIEGYLIQATTPTPDHPVYPTANGVKQQDGTYNIHTGIYVIPLRITAGGTTTDYPIYIGDSPLMEDEYVDFGEQKIYRMEGGTLTPTDPPVPIPALPTIQGETIIDYNPSETPAVEPEKMYIKYKPLHTSATIYGFRINPNEPNSSACVTYLADAVGMTPAAMGSTTFNYGSWADAFFMPKPCMLKFDGTVDYYLDPNDYSKKADGVTPSDYNNLAYSGNAMMEFPLIWYKYVPGVAEGEGYFYVSNHKVNDTYKCWSNMDCDGNIIEHFYMPIYNGCTYDGKMRSISGLTLASWSTTAYSASATYAVGAEVNYDGKMWKCTTAVETAEAFDPDKWEQFAFNGQTTTAEEIAQATACNTTAKTEWYIDTWNDRVLINGLLVLISKSIDTQGAFGRGIDSGSQAAKESYVTGSLDDKGLFYGSTANGTTAVKVFGMENWWSLAWHRTAGLIGGANNTYLYKMTASTADGSIADGYNTTGTGYPSVGGRPTTNNYVKKMQFGLFGFLPIAVGAYSTQYYKDYYYNGAGFALIGGNSNSGAIGGAFFVGLHYGAGARAWDFAAAPSCKPCKTLTANHNEEMIP